MPFNWRKHYAIKQRFNSEFNWLTEEPGIYLWKREDGDITYFYVGQAKNLKKRRFNYYCIECGLSYPTRHFEASLKKHKDWEFEVLEKCPIEELDALEKKWIQYYLLQPNFITRNELLANKDIVKSNAKRIERVETSYENNIKKMLKHLEFNFGSNIITITPKQKKNGQFTKIGAKAYEEFYTWLQKLRLQNYLETPVRQLTAEEEEQINEAREREYLMDVQGDFDNEE